MPGGWVYVAGIEKGRESSDPRPSLGSNKNVPLLRRSCVFFQAPAPDVPGRAYPITQKPRTRWDARGLTQLR